MAKGWNKGDTKTPQRIKFPIKAWLESAHMRCARADCFKSNDDTNFGGTLFRTLDRNLSGGIDGAEMENIAMGLGVEIETRMADVNRDMRLLARMKKAAGNPESTDDLTSDELEKFLCHIDLCGEWIKDKGGVAKAVDKLTNFFKSHFVNVREEL